MSNITSCDSGSFSTENINTTGVYAVVVKQQPPEILGHLHSPNSHTSTTTTTNNSNGSNTNSQPPIKKKRSLPGNPDPSAEVIALSPNTLVTTNRFICEVCNKGFQRDQNLQLHRRGHNLPWKLKQRSSTEVVRKRVYVCPEPSCVHHNPGRALGDLTGIKKHFSRKHGEKKWKCDKCSKKYAVQSDWKAHSKICGTREYKCDCGTIFSRRDSFITHRAFCDALAEENNKLNEGGGQTQLSKNIMGNSNMLQGQPNILNPAVTSLPQMIATPEFNKQYPLSSASQFPHGDHLMTAMPAATAKPFHSSIFNISPSLQLSSSNNMLLLEAENGVHLAGAAGTSPHMSATALLQKAAQMGATMSSGVREKEAGGFVTTTSMAPPSFSTELQQQPYEMIMNRYMQQHAAAAGTQDISLSTQYNNFNNANGITMDGVGMSGLDMFNAILDQSKALSKIIEQNNINIIRSTSSSADCVLNNIGRSVSSSNNISKGSEDDHGDGDVMTLDLLGIGRGGCSAHGNFYGGGGQHSETAARDHDFGAGFQSFSATSSI